MYWMIQHTDYQTRSALWDGSAARLPSSQLVLCANSSFGRWRQRRRRGRSAWRRTSPQISFRCPTQKTQSRYCLWLCERLHKSQSIRCPSSHVAVRSTKVHQKVLGLAVHCNVCYVHPVWALHTRSRHQVQPQGLFANEPEGYALMLTRVDPGRKNPSCVKRKESHRDSG